MEERTFLNATNDSFDPYDYHVLNCSENMFTTARIEGIHFFVKMMMTRWVLKMNMNLWVD